MVGREAKGPRPVGHLPDGEPYYAPIGEMRHDGDRAQCHLCGGWYKMVGGQHLIAAHGITLADYREMFRLLGTTTTAGPATSARKRATMLEQISSGERDQSVLGPPSHVTVRRWRSLAANRPDLMDEWHPTLNAGLDPYTVGQHSHRRFWWRCRDCGHEWQMAPNLRTSAGYGCPACGRARRIAATIERNRRRRVPTERTLASVRPDLLQEWHPDQNAGLDPVVIGGFSERKVWWRCSLAGCQREWQAVIGDRVKRSELGCPRCGQRRGIERRATADRERSFGALYPRLLAEWHPTRNGAIDPFALKPGSDRRLWWRCAYCGRDWQARVVSRRDSPRGGCPTCAIRLARGGPTGTSSLPDLIARLDKRLTELAVELEQLERARRRTR